MSVASAVVFEVQTSGDKELSDLFWNELESNNVSLQNLILQWLQLTQSIAEKLGSNNASEKEKDAVLQFLTKLNVVKRIGSTSYHQPDEGIVTKHAEAKNTTDNDEADVTVPQAAGQNAKQMTQKCHEKMQVKQEAVEVKAEIQQEEDGDDDGGNDDDDVDDDDDYDPGSDVNSEDSDQDDPSTRQSNREIGFICHICQQTFDDPSLTEQHIKETHDIYKKHVCPLCDKRFLRPSFLRNHAQACIRKQKQRKECENKISSQKIRREGRSQEGVVGVATSNDQTDDTATIQQFKTQGWNDSQSKDEDESSLDETYLASLNIQSDANDDNIGLACQICGETFKDPSLTKQHIEEHKKHVCTYCGQNFLKPSYLQNHVKNKHMGGSRKKCALCFESFSSETFGVHINECIPKFHCKLCNKQFFSETALKKHVQETHEKAKPHKCSVCDRGFKHKSALRRHAKIHDSNEAIKELKDPTITDARGCTINQCDKCLKIYKNTTAFKKHRCQVPAFKFPCKLCGQRCKTEESRVKHDNEFHKKIKSYFCSICGAGFVKNSDLTYHVKTVHEKAYKCVCDICGKTCSNKHYLNKHSLIHQKADPATADKEAKYQCDVCGKLCLNTIRLKKHMLYHQPPKFKCSLCEKSFCRKGSLKIHMEGVHLKVREKLCQECGAAFYTEAHLRDHVNEVHRNYRPHICKECGKGFTRPNLLQRHLKFHEKMKQLKARPRPTYPCDQCEKVYTAPSRLAMHKLHHSTERNFKCDKCGMGFKQKSSLTSHTQVVHLKIKPHACPDCGKKFATKPKLTRHIQHSHKGIKLRFPCTFCDKVLHRKYDRDTHEAWHQGLVEFKCDTCGKDYPNKQSLTLHKRTHQTDGWRCHECGSLFKNQEQRAKHKAEEHLGVTDWNKCKVCGKNFTTHQSMKRHMKNHTGNGWKCAFCGEIFPTVYAKKKHATEVHSKSKLQPENQIIVFELN